MESVAIVLLLTVLGGGALLVALIAAITTGSARTDRLRKMEEDAADLRMGLHEAYRRIQLLEQELRQANYRIEAVRVDRAALPPARVDVVAARAEPVGQPPTPAPTPHPDIPRLHQDTAAAHPDIAAAHPDIAAAHPDTAAAHPDTAPAHPDTPAAHPDTAVPSGHAAEAVPQVAPPGPAIPVWDAPAPAPYEAPAQAAARVQSQPEARSPEVAVPPPASEPAAPPVRFDWERWVGVRGAAALGACVLVIAGLYFFKYSIDNGLISPALRVVLGTLVGLGGVVASEIMLRRKYTVLANWLGGAGVAILYTSFWAAHAMYRLVGSLPSFALMTLVTFTCGFLATRHDAMVIALLGLLGGFATPVALSTGEDHPFGLFGYLLLLDSALLYLSVKRRWPILGALSLLGTFFYQAVWIGARMGPERLVLGMGIVVVFGAVYGLSLPEPRDDEGPTWPITRAATVLLPFGFGLYFGLRSDLGDRFLPLGAMLVVLSAGSAWMSRARRTAWVGTAAAVASMTVTGAWLVAHDRAGVAWEVAGLVAAIGAVFHGFRELCHARPSPAGSAGSSRAAGIAALAGLFVLVASAIAPSSHDPWPWLTGWLVLAGMAVRQSAIGAPGLRLGVALMINFGVPIVHLVHADDALFPSGQVFLSGIAVVTSLAIFAAERMRREAARASASSLPKPSADAETAEASGAPSSIAGVPKRREVGGSDEIAVLATLAFAFYFALRVEIAPHPAPLALMLAALAAAAMWAARGAPRSAWITIATAVGGLVVTGVWLGVHDASAVAWEAAGFVVLFAAAFHAFAEPSISARFGGSSTALSDAATAVASLGGMALVFAAGASPSAHLPWPTIGGALVLAGFVLRQARAEGRAPLHVPAALLLGLGVPFVYGAHLHDAASVPASVWLAVALAIAIGFSALAHLAPEGPRRRFVSHGAASLALLLLATAFESPAPPPLVFGVTAALIALALVSAARLGHGGWTLVAATWGAFVQLSYTLAIVPTASMQGPAVVALLGQLFTVLLVAVWPVIAARRFQTDAWAWRAAALAGPLWLAGLVHAWTTVLGRSAIGLVPLALGAITAGVAVRARPVLPAEGSVRKSALVWLFGVTLCSISVAVPMQLDNEWITVGWALEGVALIALWRRMDHAGLKYTALAHLAVISMRLALNPAVLDYHARGGLPVLNWLAYTYWIPTAALVGAWWLLRELEASRARRWEAGLYPKGSAIFAGANAAAAIVVFFVWINLTIFDAFGDGAELHVAFDRMPARDLTLSIAWAVYALVLLGIGVARKSAALRWTSLALIVITVGKAFLYDLSHLHDLYRVMSLVGLALSLILISLLYQRFVFSKRDEDPK